MHPQEVDNVILLDECEFIEKFLLIFTRIENKVK